MTTEHDAVREAVRRSSAKDSVDRARGGTMDRPAFANSGTVEDVKGKARQRSLRWMELGWDGTTTSAREEARKEVVLDVLRALVEDSKRGVQARIFLARWGSLW